jgi:hypothetical protein
MEIWSSGALEACCEPGNVEVWKYEAVKMRCRPYDLKALWP